MDPNDSQDRPPSGGQALAVLGGEKRYNLSARGGPGDDPPPTDPAAGTVEHDE